MHKTLRRLPSLDFLRGFEAAGRRLSFTLAAEELFVTQSALSRQVKALEDALGVALFERRHRALALTPAGVAFHRTVTEKLPEIAAAADALRAPEREPGTHGVHHRVVRVAVADPAAAALSRAAPGDDVYVSADDRVVDLARGDVDVAVRYLRDAGAPRTAVKLFGERLLPVASPTLVKRGPPLQAARPISRGHVLLHLDDPREASCRGSTGRRGSTATARAGLKPAGAIRFSLYDQVIQATLDGQGVALGRIPLIAGLLERGQLVAPFAKRYDSPRGYFAIVAPHAVARPEAAAFIAWLRDEAQARAAGTPAPRARATRRPEPHDEGPRRSHALAVDRPLRASRAPGARVLDLAAGRGRHARYFAERGAQVLAVDRDAEALAGARGRRRRRAARVLDLESGHVAARGRALRCDRRRQLPAPAAVPASARGARAGRRAALRDVRDGQRGLRAAVESRFPAVRDELLSLAALPPAPMTVVAFEQGASTGDAGASRGGAATWPRCGRRAAHGRRRWPRRARDPAERPRSARSKPPGRPRGNGVKCAILAQVLTC